MNQKLVHMFLALMAVLAAVGPLGLPSHAQNGEGAQDLPTRDQGYLRDLVLLAETIGSAHAVRVRCNGNGDQYWRSYMVQILGLEAPYQGSLRAQMVSGFNRGYELEDRQGNPCDAGSNEREARYAMTGRELSEALAAHYFPKRDD